MADERDFLDEIIEIQKDWKAVSNPLGNLATALTTEAEPEKPWDPSQYKFTARGNSTSCIRCSTQNDAICSACLDACPVGAIAMKGSSIKVSSACRKCGLCVAVCPTDAMTDGHNTPRKIYDRIVKVAASHETCYVTCTRALGRNPLDNEVVFPCVGCIPTAVWFSVLADFRNVSVYLPLGVCDRCRTKTGEEVYVDQIAKAEELTTRTVGLECDEGQMSRKKKRSYERREFMESLMRSGQQALAISNPALASARAIAKRLEDHTRQINQLQKTLEQVCGTTTNQHKRRILTQKRSLMLSTFQDHPRLAERVKVKAPVCDTSRCSMCGECVKVCPTHAIELDDAGRFSVEPIYCLSCKACAAVCPEKALKLKRVESEQLIVPDPDAERREEELKKQKVELERLKKEGRAKLGKAAKALEKLDKE